MNVQVKGCGCRLRDQKCEYLCDSHRNEFILKLYNRDIELDRMIESDALAMESMEEQRKQLVE